MASAATIEAYKAKLAAEAGIRLKLEDMLEKASAKAGKASGTTIAAAALWRVTRGTLLGER